MDSYVILRTGQNHIKIRANHSYFQLGFDQFLISHRGITQSLMSKFSLVKIQIVLTLSVYKQERWTVLSGVALTLVTVGSIPLEFYRPH